ncbi:Sepiapterin reductase [Portunus trituberculatus]|uniref:Sepiapterin reductase n=1 Tax=Portunus trituberculatus TaxID=210409 RepID=A0A5B7HRC6_PORTR|nr:Sepiapterin reductase [Portunus trituberculatus]
MIALELSDHLRHRRCPVHARTETQDDDIRKAFTSMKEEGKLLSCQTSVRKLLQVLEKDEFKSGGHVDFFEV